MVIVKFIFLIFIFFISATIGVNISKKYSSRVKELKQFFQALTIFEEKIKFTYEPIPDVFLDISNNFDSPLKEIFYNASEKMQSMSASEAWEDAIDESKNNLIKEDKDSIKALAKMLGKTDLDGQVSEIRLTKQFIKTKIEEAEYQRNKNEKLYRTLGITFGLTIVIILIWN